MAEEKPKAPLIGGDFSGPKGNTSRTPSLQSKETLSKDESEPEEKEADEEEKEEKSVEDVVVLYQENLRKLDISPEIARKILDNVLFGGGYKEEFTIGGGRIKFTLTTRKYRDLQRTLRYLDSEVPLSPTHMNDLIARYNTAASLASYGERQFSFPNPEDSKVTVKQIEDAFDERLNFLSNLDTPIVERIIARTSEFDRKMAAVLADGAPEDF